MEVGNSIKIIPNETHLEFVKKFYGKILKISKIVEADTTLYKIKGIKGYALSSDIQLC